MAFYKTIKWLIELVQRDSLRITQSPLVTNKGIGKCVFLSRVSLVFRDVINSREIQHVQ